MKGEQEYIDAMNFKEQQRAYLDYLDGLIHTEQFELLAVEICLNYFDTDHFKESGFTEKDYLIYKKKYLTKL